MALDFGCDVRDIAPEVQFAAHPVPSGPKGLNSGACVKCIRDNKACDRVEPKCTSCREEWRDCSYDTPSLGAQALAEELSDLSEDASVSSEELPEFREPVQFAIGSPTAMAMIKEFNAMHAPSVPGSYVPPPLSLPEPEASKASTPKNISSTKLILKNSTSNPASQTLTTMSAPHATTSKSVQHVPIAKAAQQVPVSEASIVKSTTALGIKVEDAKLPTTKVTAPKIPATKVTTTPASAHKPQTLKNSVSQGPVAAHKPLSTKLIESIITAAKADTKKTAAPKITNPKALVAKEPISKSETSSKQSRLVSFSLPQSRSTQTNHSSASTSV